jgi:hypothetical protein
MTVNSIGDLYFTGKATVTPPESSYDAVYRQDAVKIALGNSQNPKELYSRSTTGNPNSKVWMPSGIAVDSFNIYWGNQELGSTHGSVVAGPRQNVEGIADQTLRALSTSKDEVRGMAATGTAIYYLTPEGVFGVSKTAPTAVTEQYEGLVAGPPSEDTNGAVFDPRSIAWDGDGTVYFSDFTRGAVYSLPALDMGRHTLSKFVDAPGVHGMSVAVFETSSASSLASESKLLFGLSTLIFAMSVVATPLEAF